MRRATKQSTSLVEKIIKNENDRHANRMAAIKRMEKKLKLFEPIFQAMEERKASLSLNNFWVYDDTLSIDSGLLTDWNISRYDALIDIGFVEYDRFTNAHYATCKLKMGRIRVSIMIPSHHKAGAA